MATAHSRLLSVLNTISTEDLMEAGVANIEGLPDGCLALECPLAPDVIHAVQAVLETAGYSRTRGHDAGNLKWIVQRYTNADLAIMLFGITEIAGSTCRWEPKEETVITNRLIDCI